VIKTTDTRYGRAGNDVSDGAGPTWHGNSLPRTSLIQNNHLLEEHKRDEKIVSNAKPFVEKIGHFFQLDFVNYCILKRCMYAS
jgi:hypothetical protein